MAEKSLEERKLEALQKLDLTLTALTVVLLFCACGLCVTLVAIAKFL
jgi:hypothetical protein